MGNDEAQQVGRPAFSSNSREYLFQVSVHSARKKSTIYLEYDYY